MLITIYQIIVAGVGLLLIYAGLFVYPDERRFLQNRVDDAWLLLAEISDKSNVLYLRYSKNTAKVIIKFFDMYFGDKLISRRSVIVSVIVSAWLSSFLYAYLIVIFSLIHYFSSIGGKYVFLLLIVFSLIIAFLFHWVSWLITKSKRFQASFNTTKAFYISLISIVLFSPLTITLIIALVNNRESDFFVHSGVFGLVFAVIFVIVSDLASIYISRKLLAIVASSKSAAVIIASYLLDSIVAIFIFCLPLIPLVYIINVEQELLYGIALVLMGVLIANLSTLIPTAIYIFYAFSVAINHVVWNSILRPLYALVDGNIFEKKRLLVTMGMLLIAEAHTKAGLASLRHMLSHYL